MLYKNHWGKSDRKDLSLWRPYVEHVAAVALVAQELVRLTPALRNNLRSLLGGVSEKELHDLVGWVAVNHDIGKLHPCFQWKYVQGYERVYGNLTERGYYMQQTSAQKYYHGTGGYFWAKALKIPDWREDLEPFLRASCAHHGGYGVERDRLVVLPQKREEVALTAKAMTAFYEETLDYYDPVQVAGVQDTNRLSQVFAGLVAVADWLGSNEESFPMLEKWGELRSITEALNCKKLQDAAAAVIKDNGFTETPKVVQDMPVPGTGFSSLQDYVGGLTEAQVVIVEAPTGDGKTEAALKLAQGWFKKGVADRIVFALPTKATANAMLGRVTDFVRTIFKAKVQVQLAHGDSFHAMRALNHNLGTNDASRFGFDWFRSGKRKLLSPASVCTIDQILASVLKGNRHHFVKTYALSSAIVIIDEVHAVDVYMGKTLQSLLQNLTSLGARVILLSATLSPKLRADLLESFGAATNNQTKGYPLVTSWSKTSGVAVQAEASRRADRKVKIKVQGHDWDDPLRPFKAHPKDCMRLTQELVDSVKAGAGVCWIRNSVAEAQQAAQDALKAGLDESQIYLLHAGLRGKDRANIEGRILKNFGPNGARDPMLVIGTQILEQSLDIDFDRLVRDLSTVDSLIQALGRCHRHPKNARPTGCKEPELEVFMPKDLSPKGNLYRYIHEGKLHPLKKTWDWLSRATEIVEPSGVPDLIESVFDGTCFPEVLKDDEKPRLGDGGKATQNLIQVWPKGNAYGVEDAMDYKAPTRLGEPNRQFLFLSVTATKGVYRLPDGIETLDLTPFQNLMSETDIKVLRKETQKLWPEWSKVLNFLREFACGRSTFQESDVVTVDNVCKDLWTKMLSSLLEAEKYPVVTVIKLDSPTDMAEVERVRNKALKMKFNVGYCNFLGFLVSK